MSTESTEPAFGAKHAVNMARILDEANVGNVLWGWLAVSLIQNDRHFPEIEFVIPDKQIQLATDALVAAELPLCTDAQCSELRSDRLKWNARPRDPQQPLFVDLAQDQAQGVSDWSKDNLAAILAHNRRHPVGAAHFHLDTHVLHLLRQSEILFWMPEIPPGPPAADDLDLMLSTDPSLPAKMAVWPPPPREKEAWEEAQGPPSLSPAAQRYCDSWLGKAATTTEPDSGLSAGGEPEGLSIEMPANLPSTSSSEAPSHPLVMYTDMLVNPGGANNGTGPSGPWSELYPVKILNPDSYTESIIWLLCRDMERDESLLDRWSDVRSALHDNAMFKKRLRPRFRYAWDTLNMRYNKHCFCGLAYLRKELIDSGELPQDLPFVSICGYDSEAEDDGTGVKQLYKILEVLQVWDLLVRPCHSFTCKQHGVDIENTI
ncbi:uncharacterized protein BJX67DRAFT_377225 [Aspergillus lucknowensis]|uniref:Uncharacterized protein n=1 Tax=Aspergillus lucknowensis TaxID=176173 RepID=A0ABR4M4D2_9EURO